MSIAKSGIELLLPDCAKEVEDSIKAGYVPERAVRNVYLSHPMIQNVLKSPAALSSLLREKFPSIFPSVSTRDIKDAAQRYLHQGAHDREFLEDISSVDEYRRALNALS